MSLNLVDISSYQGNLNLEAVNYDGVAIKATEGISYVNPDCDKHYQEAKVQGKKRAVYHFFDFGVDALAQADFFVNNCRGYIRDAIFVLDWEGTGVADVGQALAFLQRVEQLIGYKPAIYMSMWVENTYDWSGVVNNNNGLWLARYSNWELANHADNFDMSNAGQPPTVVHWPFYFMWQWTSTGYLSGYAGDLDCDIAYLTGAQWDAYAGVQAAPAPTTTVTPTTTTTPPPTTTEPPVTTTTTTVAPTTTEPPAPTTTEAPSTTANPTTSQPTEATTTEPTPVTTTEAPNSGESVSWLTVIWSVVIAFIHQLQGKGKK